MAKTLNSRIPEGPVAEKWTNYKAHQRLVNPKNKLKLICKINIDYRALVPVFKRGAGG